MPRGAWILVLVVAGVLAAGLLAAAFVVAAGSGEEDARVTFEQATRQLELPLAEDERAVMLAARNGRVLVGIAAKPGGPIQVAAVDGEQAVPESDLTFTIDGRLVTPTSCGHACSELDVDSARELVVNAPETFRFELPANSLPSGASLFAEVTRTMESLRTYRFEERLTSGIGPGVTSTWEVQAPNRMRLQTADSRSIIVGKTRWDRRAGRWERTPHPGVEVPSYMWDGAGNARILGRTAGKQILSVFDREPLPAWFRLTVDRQKRVVDAEMLAPSHFMRQRFRDFNGPIRIAAPT